MTVKIEIEETQIAEMVSKGIEGMDKSVVSDILKDALFKAFSDPEVAKSVVFEKQRGYDADVKLRGWVERLVESAVKPEEMEHIKKTVLDMLEQHAMEMVVAGFARSISSNLFDYDTRAEFAQSLTTSVMNRIRS